MAFEIVDNVDMDLIEIRQILNPDCQYRLVAEFDSLDRDMAEAAIAVWTEKGLGKRWVDALPEEVVG